ncbi:hypothetical protein MW7_013665 [Imbroritus primus]|uniref:Uncharacterized protein n=1 Tax=Imbroritus primus TaxID=3058603 RepID=A0ACD3SLL1_9BURK|nr:hypothetical protein MW7_013665 [Burkholderiaceae bacterium PBA]
MNTTVSPYTTATLQTRTAANPPGAAQVAAATRKARSRRTLRPMQQQISFGGVLAVTRSPVAHADLQRAAATLPYNAPAIPRVQPPLKAARWQVTHARAAARTVLPETAPRRRATAAHHTASRPTSDDPAAQPFQAMAEACALTGREPAAVEALLNTLTPQVFIHASRALVAGMPHPHNDAMAVAGLLARSGAGFDALLMRLPRDAWPPLQREALRIWLNAREAAQAPDASEAQRQSCAQEIDAAWHALQYLQDHPAASAREVAASLRKVGLLVPYFNRKHGFDHPEDVALAQRMLLAWGIDLRRAHKLRTSWRARYHPRRLAGRKKSALAAMHKRMTGLRRDLAQRERARLDRALQQAASTLFADPHREMILRALFDSAAPEHKLEVVRQIVILRHLHRHAQADQQHGVAQQRPFFAPLDLTPQQMARETLQEMQRLAPELARNDPALLRVLQEEARVMLMPASQLKHGHWRPPTVQHLLAWHAQWLAALDRARLDGAQGPALHQALEKLHAHLQDAAETVAEDPQMHEMTPDGVQREFDDMYGRMHNHSAVFHSGGNLGIAARVVLSIFPGIGVAPRLKRTAGRDAVIAVGQSLSGSYLAIGRQSRSDGEIGVDAVLGTEALAGTGAIPLQATIAAGIDAGYRQLRGFGLMIRANKLLDANGKVITWNRDGQPAPDGIDSNRWTMQQVNAFLRRHCTLQHGEMTVPADAAALWEDFAAAFFDSPNLQLAVYRESRTTHTAGARVQATAKLGTRDIGLQASAGVRAELGRERQRMQERSTQNAAMHGGHQTRRGVVASARLGVPLPGIAPTHGSRKVSVPPAQIADIQARFADRRRNVQYRLQQVDGKLDASCFRYEIVSTLPAVRAILARDADIWHDMADGKARLEHFYTEYERSYADLPNVVFYVICDLRRPAARKIDNINGQLALLEARLARQAGQAAADATEQAALSARIAVLQQQRQQILETRSNWTPYAIDVRQTVTGGQRTGPGVGLVLQHTAGVDATHVLMRLTAKPEDRHAGRVRFEAALGHGG